MGREAELSQLHRWLEQALQGERQVIFVTGELGIGKTALVDAFVQRLAVNGALRIGRGQCVQTYGSGEAYLPALDALGRLCREPGGEQVIALLIRCAPTWLAQMPWLLDDAALGVLQRKIRGATRERMLRELTETVDALTAETPLLLILEDLQWSDYSTIDLLSVLARRQELARLLMIGTYRPVDVNTAGHPLQAVKQELQMHGYCRELQLRLLSETDVAEYLAARVAFHSPWIGKPCLGSPAPLQQLAQLIHQRTDGNPLFIVNIVDSLMAQGVIAESSSVETPQVTPLRPLEEVLDRIPESLQQMIENQFKRLSREKQRVLEAASVVGRDFTAAAVAAELGIDALRVEGMCEELVQHAFFLKSKGTSEWANGTVTAHYGFIHALYREVLYRRVPAGKRAQLYQQIGERLNQTA